jgi:hypothetical protein
MGWCEICSHRTFTEHAFTYTPLTFSLALQDLDDIGGVGTHSHSFHFSHFDPEPFHLPIALFNNYYLVSNIDPTPEGHSRTQPTDLTTPVRYQTGHYWYLFILVLVLPSHITTAWLCFWAGMINYERRGSKIYCAVVCNNDDSITIWLSSAMLLQHLHCTLQLNAGTNFWRIFGYFVLSPPGYFYWSEMGVLVTKQIP